VTAHHIGALNEKALHANLKQWYAEPGDRIEVKLDGFFIDIVRGDTLIEIQTRDFSAIKRKMHTLTTDHPVALVYPIANEKWIIKQDDRGKQLGRRKSPKRGNILHVFEELVSFPELLKHPNFSLEVLSIQEEEIRRHDKRRGWRRHGWVTHERRLLKVLDRQIFTTPDDCAALLPPGLKETFTTRDLANALDRPRRLAQKMAYCLHKMDALTQTGKQGNARVYCISGNSVDITDEKNIMDE
jgi:hypothetical protein